MLATGWTPEQVAALDPERRERLLWGIHARRLVEIRDRQLTVPPASQEAVAALKSELATIDVSLFPGSIPAPRSPRA
jgi:hypothetical protein